MEEDYYYDDVEQPPSDEDELAMIAEEMGQGNIDPASMPMQVASTTPPYGTRREPIGPVPQDADNLDMFIDRSMRQQMYGNMPPMARDVNEQADMIRGAAPRTRDIEMRRMLEEQMKGQGYILPPPPEMYIDPRDEEDTYYGRRFS
jgi:hypothetical protein